MAAWAVLLVWLVGAAGAGAQPEPDQPGVAVLPFRVHSAKPIDYLGESLANLVAPARGERSRARARPAEVDGRRTPGALRETAMRRWRDGRAAWVTTTS